MFGIKWDELDLLEVADPKPRRYPYRTREQAEGEARAAIAMAPEVFAGRHYEVVEEEEGQ